MLPTTFNIFTPTTYFTVEKQYGNSGTITKIYGKFVQRIFPSRIRKSKSATKIGLQLQAQ